MNNGLIIGDEPYTEQCENCEQSFDPEEMKEVYKHGSLEGLYCPECVELVKNRHTC